MAQSNRSWKQKLLLGMGVALAVGLAACGEPAKTTTNTTGMSTPPKQLAFAYQCGASAVTPYPVDPTTGVFGTKLATVIDSFLNNCAITPNGKFLYGLVSSVSGANLIRKYQVNPDGTLHSSNPATLDDATDTTASLDASAIAVDPAGKFLIVTNNAAALGTPGTVVVYSIDQTTGVLTFKTSNQLLPDPINFPSSGTNATRILFHPNGKFVYLISGASNSNAVPLNYAILPYSLDSAGNLTPVGSPVALPGASGSIFTTAMTADGSRLYVAGNNFSVFLFDIGITGSLTQVSAATLTTAANPSVLAIDPSGKYIYIGELILAKTNNLLAFSIGANGTPTAIPGAVYSVNAFNFAAPGTALATNPTSMSIDPTGKFLFTLDNTGAAGVDGFTINPATGQLSHIGGLGNYSEFPVQGSNTADLVFVTK